MWLRFQIWRSRRRARQFSKFSPLEITARVNGIPVGYFRRGKEKR